MSAAAVIPDVIRDATGRAMGGYERLCWERHARDLELCAQPGGHPRGFVFSPEHAERPVRFVEEFCRHYKGEWAGQPIRLDGEPFHAARTQETIPRDLV